MKCLICFTSQVVNPIKYLCCYNFLLLVINSITHSYKWKRSCILMHKAFTLFFFNTKPWVTIKELSIPIRLKCYPTFKLWLYQLWSMHNKAYYSTYSREILLTAPLSRCRRPLIYDAFPQLRFYEINFALWILQ